MMSVFVAQGGKWNQPYLHEAQPKLQGNIHKTHVL